MEENIRRFQNGELPEVDQDWHKLVPKEALEALDNNEIKRQGLIFELLKAEREYVVDLEAMEQIFIKGLRESNPPILGNGTQEFITTVFRNIHDILVHHQQMLETLFRRQRTTHPLIQSIADIFLESTILSDPHYS
jgi:RhoGEF, Guanine nucleotide exchange factor for Rho/Rac/Cdc42-like GTPases